LVTRSKIRVDFELEEALRSFKTETPEEVECRRELLRYKRRVDDVVRELVRLTDDRPRLEVTKAAYPVIEVSV
jgi:hypothetical protein